MADDHEELKKRGRAATMQIDAVEDALEVLEELEAARAKFAGAQVVGDDDEEEDEAPSGGPSAPPPLPPRTSAPAARPSSAPEPRSPVIYVVGGVVALAAAAAGIWLASTLLDEEPAPAADSPVMEIGPIEVTSE